MWIEREVNLRSLNWPWTIPLLAGLLEERWLHAVVVVLILLLPKILPVARDWRAEKRIGEARATEAEARAELIKTLVGSAQDKGSTKESSELLGHLQLGTTSQAESDASTEQLKGSE